MAVPMFISPAALPSQLVSRQHAFSSWTPSRPQYHYQKCRRATPITAAPPAPRCAHTSSIPSTSSSSPVLAPIDTPAQGALSSPVVHQYFTDDGPHYVMWYTSRPPQWQHADRAPPGTLSGFISLALSDDGLVWRRVTGPRPDAALLGPNDEQWWTFDTTHLSAGSVLLTSPARVRADAGVYLLYYSGGGSEPIEHMGVSQPGARTRIGVAISKDGEHFSRIEGDFPSGAVLDIGDPDAFDSAFVAAPSVLRMDDASPANRYVMFYHGASTADLTFAIGLAVSSDGFDFTRASSMPVLSRSNAPADANWALRGVCRPCVVMRGDRKRWTLFVEVVDDTSTHRIAMCESDDGVQWGTLTLVLDVGEQGAWDAAGVSHPCAVQVDGGGLLLYYVGKRADHNVDAGRGTCVGVAQSEGPDWSRLRRVSGGASITV